MADIEKTTILNVQTGEAVKNIRELRDNIKLLKDALNDANATEEENAATLTELRANQNALKDAMYQSSKTTEQLIEDSKNLNGSYNELVHTMAELKMRWRETTDETERAKLGERIKEINDSLKEMDASVGNFQRNVGDYQNSFENAMKYSLGLTKDLGGSIGNLSNTILKLIPVIKAVSKTATTGIKGVKAALTSSGIGAIIVILGTVVTKLIEFVKSSREAADSSEVFRKAQEKATSALEEHNRELQRRLTLMRATGSTSVDTAKEELDAIEELIEKQVQYIGKLKNEKFALEQTQLFTKKVKEEKIAAKQAEIEANQEVLRNLIETQKDQKVAYEAAIQAQLLKINEATQTALMTRKQALKKEYDEDIAFMKAHNASIDDIEARDRRYYKELAELDDSFNKKREQDAKAAQERLEKANKFYQEWAAKVLAAERAQFELQVELTKGTKEELDARIALAQYDLSSMYQKEGETIEEYRVRVAKATNTLRELQAQQAQDAYNEEHLKFENKMNALMEGSTQYLEAELELKQFELDSLHRLEEESDEEFRARQLAADKAYRQAKDNLLMAQISSLQRYAGAVSGIMGSLADILETGTQDDLKAAERAKSIRIASATIDTISGAIGAFMQAVKSVPAPYGAILGAAEAAAVTAAGVAEIQKIKSTKITANGSSSSPSSTVSSTVSAPTIEQSIPQTALITSASDEEKLNQIGDQKVYILSSDLEANGRRVAVQEGESSF